MTCDQRGRRGRHGQGHHGEEALIQARFMYRFGEVRGITGCLRRLGIAPLSLGRQKNEPGRGQQRIGLDRPGQFQAVHPGHLHVNDGKVARGALRSRRAQAGQGLLAVHGQPAPDAPFHRI